MHLLAQQKQNVFFHKEVQFQSVREKIGWLEAIHQYKVDPKILWIEVSIVPQYRLQKLESCLQQNLDLKTLQVAPANHRLQDRL